MDDAWDVEFFVPGLPRPEARKRVGANGRIFHVRRDDVKSWEMVVHEFAKAVVGDEVLWPKGTKVELRLMFYLKPTKKMRPENLPLPHKGRLDADNMAKVLQDALKGSLYADDGQVMITADKCYNLPTGVVVQARAIKG